MTNHTDRRGHNAVKGKQGFQTVHKSEPIKDTIDTFAPTFRFNGDYEDVEQVAHLLDEYEQCRQRVIDSGLQWSTHEILNVINEMPSLKSASYMNRMSARHLLEELRQIRFRDEAVTEWGEGKESVVDFAAIKAGDKPLYGDFATTLDSDSHAGTVEFVRGGYLMRSPENNRLYIATSPERRGGKWLSNTNSRVYYKPAARLAGPTT